MNEKYRMKKSFANANSVLVQKSAGFFHPMEHDHSNVGTML